MWQPWQNQTFGYIESGLYNLKACNYSVVDYALGKGAVWVADDDLPKGQVYGDRYHNND